MDVNRVDDSGETPIFIAIDNNDLSAVNDLIRLGADVNFQNRMRETPLHLASRDLKYDIIKILLRNGADPTKKDSVGEIPLHLMIIAASDNEDANVDKIVEIMYLMIQRMNKEDKKKYINTKDNYQQDALSFALRIRDLDVAKPIVRFLLSNGASITKSAQVRKLKQILPDVPAQRVGMALASKVFHSGDLYVNRNGVLIPVSTLPKEIIDIIMSYIPNVDKPAYLRK